MCRFPGSGEWVSRCEQIQPFGAGALGEFRRAIMFKAAVWSVLGVVAGMVGSVANAQYYYSPVGYSYGVRPVYSAPIPVGVSSFYAAPVIVARPVYIAPVVVSRPVYVSPVVQTVYSAPVYSSPIETASYSTISTSLEPTPVYTEPTVSYYQPAPVYVTPAPVVVSRAIYSPAVVRESLTVRPFSTTYRAQGFGYSVYARSTPHRSVTRIRGW